MSFDKSRHQVSAALNHAARTFQSFDAEDWRAMAEECSRRVEAMTCVDCGRDCSIGKFAAAPSKPGYDHRIKCGRWSCGWQP